MTNTTPVLARNSVRIAIYAVLAVISSSIFLGGLSPLVINDLDVLENTGFYGVLLGGVPLLLLRTRFFHALIISGRGEHWLAQWHIGLFRLFSAALVVAVALMVWRASAYELRGWKTAFLLFYGLFLFYVAGWIIHPPRFLLRKLE